VKARRILIITGVLSISNKFNHLPPVSARIHNAQNPTPINPELLLHQHAEVTLTPTLSGNLSLMHKATRAGFPETHRRSRAPTAVRCAVMVTANHLTTRSRWSDIAPTESGDLPLRHKAMLLGSEESLVGRATAARAHGTR
jgi:hypothetical protein